MAAVLTLVAPSLALAASPLPRTETAVLAGGCFWGMEDVFEKLRGVRDVTSGYSGGRKATATYDQVSTGTTGHAESVRIRFDPARISFRTLLDVYFTVALDPTERDRQGPDDGPQYRSVIFYTSDAQRRQARAAIAELTRAKTFASPIVTAIEPFRAFYLAEAYHQHFAERNPTYPYIVYNDAPKVVALQKRFPALVKP
jgi:peptide-methionine (S)-S-oxide reductase